MAEIKNSFLRSKMNKDLDDRLIPNGEYRDAQNISVGKSEADDIGSLETVLGNTLASNFGLSGMTVIGYHAIENSNSIIVFLTNASGVHNIYKFSPPNTKVQLVTGSFLNFSLTKPITGISVIENLLFWTDYNNQPRKINLTKPFGYYTTESDISVAKYNPYQPISLLKKVKSVVVDSANTDNFTDTVSETRAANTQILGGTLGPTPASRFTTYGANTIKCTLNGTTVATDGVTDALLNSLSTQAGGGGSPAKQEYNFTINTSTTIGDVLTFVVPGPTNKILLTTVDGVEIGMSVISTSSAGVPKILASQYVTVTAINVATKTITVSANVNVATGDILNFLATTMTGEDITFNFNNGSSATWPGDPDYLESRFIRLSYRFEFDDGEYSLMAPFTPITFIPKQKGYFLGSGGATPTADDENSTYRSTIVEFMENGVQNIELLIPFPDTLNNVQPESIASYKIKAVDILYKESDATAVKVIDTINYNDADENGNAWTATSNTNILTYNYQSRKPFRTLPTSQTVRVYDKVPVKAFAQETAGNRIIYGNFLDKYSPPTFLNYTVAVSPKSTLIGFDSWAEFPTQSVKQNRNYQVGFVLADKFGRQSDVILSSVKTSTTTVDGTIFGGDTIYSSYNTLSDNASTPIRDWFGDSLKIDINSPIISTTPGLYANSLGGYDTFQSISSGDQPSISGNTYIFKLTAGATQTTTPTIGSYLPGEFTDYVYVSNIQANTPTTGKYTVTTVGQVSSTYLQQSPSTTDVKYAYSINEIGWYSYKIVVKQTEQDYYNVYLPGIIKGYPNNDGVVPLISFPDDPPSSVANIVLINDNINKIPRDLSEVGPDQKQFRSSVQLFGRVQNNMTTGTPGVASNLQYYPGIKTDTAISVSASNDANMAFEIISTNTATPALYASLSATGQASVYQLDSNPLIARLSTSVSIGAESTSSTTTSMIPFLAIYETEPVESLLDIFWETPTVGLISDLNDAIASDYTGAVGWEAFSSSNFKESNTGDFITGLRPVGQNGAPLNNTSISSISVTNQDDTGVTEGFVNPVVRTGSAGTPADPFKYNFSKVANQSLWPNGFAYNENANLRNFTITSTITNLTTGVVSNPLNIDIQLQNEIPTITGAPTLPVINNNTGTSGVIVDVNGFNGAIRTASNQDELQWSMTGGGSYFTINAGTGQITQTSAIVGTYNLLITLKDANGTGASSAVTTQQVVVSSTAVGFGFQAGQADGSIAQVCPFGGSVAPTCGSITYYNTGQGGGGGGTGTPVAGDIISTTEFTVTPAGIGFYSFNCANGTGTSRRYFRIISNTTGEVHTVTNCGP